MRRFTKLLMIILSYSPIATVAVAAQARANEIEGESQSLNIREMVRAARARLIPAGYVSTTMEDARNLFSSKTGLDGADLDVKMREDLDLLMKSGLIQFDEKTIMASGPSEHAISGG